MNKLVKISTLGLCLLSGLVTSIIAPVTALAAEASALAIVPNKHFVPFQARLHDEVGVELNGIYQLNFKLYDQETTGTTLWSETHENVSVVSGYVNVLLGGINDLKNDDASSSSTVVPIDFSKQRYLGISIGKYVKQGGNTSTVLSNELLPRHQLVPSFHAATATDSAKLGGYAAELWSKKSEMLSAVGIVQDDLNYIRNSSFTPGTRQVEQPDGSFVTETYYIAGKSINASHALTAANAANADNLGNVAASSYLQSADLNDYATKASLANYAYKSHSHRTKSACNSSVNSDYGYNPDTSRWRGCRTSEGETVLFSVTSYGVIRIMDYGNGYEKTTMGSRIFTVQRQKFGHNPPRYYFTVTSTDVNGGNSITHEVTDMQVFDD